MRLYHPHSYQMQSIRWNEGIGFDNESHCLLRYQSFKHDVSDTSDMITDLEKARDLHGRKFPRDAPMHWGNSPPVKMDVVVPKTGITMFSGVRNPASCWPVELPRRKSFLIDGA